MHYSYKKQALNHGLVLKNVIESLSLIKKACLKPYIDMNTDLRKAAKNNFEENIFKLMNNSVFGKTIENVRKHRDIKLIITEKRKNYLVSEPNYHTTKFCTENLLTIVMRKTEILMNKSVYLGLSILDLGKMLMYEFWYDYVKAKYDEKTKLC